MTLATAPNPLAKPSSIEEALATLTGYVQGLPLSNSALEAPGGPVIGYVDPADWGERNYWIPDPAGGPTAKLIKLLPHQRTILRLMFDPRCHEFFDLGLSTPTEYNPTPQPLGFQTLIYSTVKKSGKSSISAMVARWITETWGSHVETYCLANDLEQARGRSYAMVLSSVELDPRYQRADKGIPGLWRIIEREAQFLPTHSTLKAVSSDYKGEAGSSPVATFWSELWAYQSEASQRLWEELTPVPTRPRSIRFVDTYAGYDNESSILNELEDRIKDKKVSYQLTRSDLSHIQAATGVTLEWPFDDEVLPFYISPKGRTFAYWDDGEKARRMPWQTPEYYTAQQEELRENAYKRLHLNIRVSSTEEFIPIEWWDRLGLDTPPTLDRRVPVVVGADASVTGDYSAIVGVIRDPSDKENIIQVLCEVWEPAGGKALDYSKTIEPTLREWCKRYNIVEIAYDEYQLHDMMTRLRNDGVAWCKKFSQQGDRMVADKALFDRIRDQRMKHVKDTHMREAIQNCAAKVPADDNTRLRLVKKAKKSKIDPAVALSMASHECQRLNL